MKLSKLAVLCFLSVFAFATFADDFNDEPSSSPTAPPSASGDYNQELMDATHGDQPKVPEPESKPAATAPMPGESSAPAKSSHHKKPAKKKAGKTSKKAAKGKKGAKKKKHKKAHAAE